MRDINIITIALAGGTTVIKKGYAPNDPIWVLPVEKRERKALADIQRELIVEADRRTLDRVTERG